jgi:tellurite resistance protein TehA-like permease
MIYDFPTILIILGIIAAISLIVYLTYKLFKPIKNEIKKSSKTNQKGFKLHSR